MTANELSTYWQVIRKRLWLIMLIVVVAMGVVLFVSFASRPTYQASAYFQVTAPLPEGVSLFRDFRTSTSRDELLYTKNNFLAVLQSESVVWQVIEKTDLDATPDELLAQMTLAPDEDSDFVRLSVTAEDARTAALVANTWLEVASLQFGELSAGSISANKDFVDQQLQLTKEQLDLASQALIAFKVKHGIGSPEGLVTLPESMIRNAQEKRDAARAGGQTAVAAQYDQIIAGYQKDLEARILLSAEYSQLQQAVERVNSVYTSLLNTQTEAQLKENEVLSARYIQVMPAFEPTQPRPRLNTTQLALAAAISLAVGILLAFVLEAIQPSTDPGKVAGNPLTEGMFGSLAK